MKKRYIVYLALFIFVLFAAVSNPSREDYVSFVKGEISKEGHPFIGMFSGPFINSFTTKQNYGLYTLYKTKFDHKQNDDYLEAIGFFNNFYWIHEPITASNK